MLRRILGALSGVSVLSRDDQAGHQSGTFVERRVDLAVTADVGGILEDPVFSVNNGACDDANLHTFCDC